MKVIIHNTQLSALKLPLIIPKRKKGSTEVLANCSVKGAGVTSSVDFVGYLRPYANVLCDRSIPLEILGSMQEKSQAKNLNLNIGFNYHLDRATPTYEPTFYELYCFYDAVYVQNKQELSMGITIPIRLSQVGFIGVGELSIIIREPKIAFFEDLLDNVQKYLGIRIYPITSDAEEMVAGKVIDTGKTVKEYMQLLSDVSGFNKISRGGRALISTKDVYNMYEIITEVTW